VAGQQEGWAVSEFKEAYALTTEERGTARDLAEASPQEKTEYIYDLTVSMRFCRGVTTKELSEIWGISRREVSKYAEMARRMVVHDQGRRYDPDELRAEIHQRYEVLLQKALTRTKWVTVKTGRDETIIEEVPDPDLKTAVLTQRAISDMYGLGSHRMIDQANKLIGKSKSELEEMASAFLAELRDVKDNEVPAEGQEVDNEAESSPARLSEHDSWRESETSLRGGRETHRGHRAD
jgi:hypothetical protein